jgi:hypothetical protein
MTGRCKFISGDPVKLIRDGVDHHCGKPVAREGEAWCAEHRAIVYAVPEQAKAA